MGIKTLGGKQYWTDRLVVSGYRVQEHVRFGRVRVLGPDDRRLHTGTSRQEARAVFEAEVPRPQCARRHLVVLLHGYGGSATSMNALRDAARAGGFAAEALNYPSYFRNVEEVVSGVAAAVVDSATYRGDISTVSLVGFSMGGLVARSVVTRLAQLRNAPRIGRIATIGTPHRGSPIAALAGWLTPIGGPNIVELQEANRRELSAPNVRFGVVGGSGHTNGWTLLGAVGDGDGVVELSSSVIPGAEDKLVAPRVKHAKLPADPTVVAGVVRYLDTGRFGAPQ